MFGSVSTKMLCAYLERYGWDKFKILDDDDSAGKILTGWQSSPLSEGHPLVIDLNKPASAIVFKALEVAKAPPGDQSPADLADILTVIGFVNYRTIIGKFSYDPSDGEICYEYAIPTDDSKLSYEQFAHILKAMTSTVDYWGERITEACDHKRTGLELIESFQGKF